MNNTSNTATTHNPTCKERVVVCWQHHHVGSKTLFQQNSPVLIGGAR